MQHFLEKVSLEEQFGLGVILHAETNEEDQLQQVFENERGKFRDHAKAS